MKKNKMMRLASSLLVAVLLTSSVISGTFAKYVTEGSATDTARVAKWGVTVTAKDNTAFSKMYEDHKTTATDTEAIASVVSSDTMNVVAPGTSGTFTGVNVEGAPEVDVAVVHVATITLGDWTITGDFDKDDSDETVFYCPLVFNVNGTVVDGKNFNDSANLVNALKLAIEGSGNDGQGRYLYQAGTDLSTLNDIAITWEWPFSTSEMNDAKDTALGDKAANETDVKITVKVVTSVTQVD